MTDYLKLKALRTFDAGLGLKTADSEPFDIEAGHGRELIALGLAERVGDGNEPQPPETEPQPKPAEPISSVRAPRAGKKKDEPHGEVEDQ